MEEAVDDGGILWRVTVMLSSVQKEWNRGIARLFMRRVRLFCLKNGLIIPII